MCAAVAPLPIISFRILRPSLGVTSMRLCRANAQAWWGGLRGPLTAIFVATDIGKCVCSSRTCRTARCTVTLDDARHAATSALACCVQERGPPQHAPLDLAAVQRDESWPSQDHIDLSRAIISLIPLSELSGSWKRGSKNNKRRSSDSSNLAKIRRHRLPDSGSCKRPWKKCDCSSRAWCRVTSRSRRPFGHYHLSAPIATNGTA